MSSRGEENFVNLPGFGARLYDSLTQTRAIQVQLGEIARDLVSRFDRGRLLDIGTGPGRLLLEIHKLNPAIELFGLDIAASMIQVAMKNLSGIRVDLRQGNIRHTDYESNFFDTVTCTGSFYLWDHPEECLEEIFRILKAGQSAYLFETHQEFNHRAFQEALRTNLRQENLLRRLITPYFLKRQLKMTYRIGEVVTIVRHTSFAHSYTIEKIALAGLPVWLRITLTKNSQRCR